MVGNLEHKKISFIKSTVVPRGTAAFVMPTHSQKSNNLCIILDQLMDQISSNDPFEAGR